MSLKRENWPEMVWQIPVPVGFTEVYLEYRQFWVGAVEGFFSGFKGRRDSGIDFKVLSNAELVREFCSIL